MPLKAGSRPPNNPVAIFIGPAGGGKTTTACLFPRPYVIDLDRNLAGPFRYLEEKENKAYQGILYDSVAVDDNANEVNIKLQNQRFTKLLSDAYRNPDIDTVIIDSATALGHLLAYQTATLCKLQPTDKWEFEQWRIYLGLWTNLITQIRDRTKTTIITAHEELKEIELEKTVRYTIMIQGSAKTTVPALVTDMWRFWIKKKVAPEGTTYKRMITIVQDGKHIDLKSSLKMPDNEFENKPETVKKILMDNKLIIP